MNAWVRDRECENDVPIPDGNGEFTDGMGMLVHNADLGFGKRSWRYSMPVQDGAVQESFIEPNKPGDPFEVSDADTMLEYINPTGRMPVQVAIFNREGCHYCAKAKALLAELGYDCAEVPLPQATRSRVVGAVTGESTVPRVFIDGEHIGGRKPCRSGRNPRRRRPEQRPAVPRREMTRGPRRRPRRARLASTGALAQDDNQHAWPVHASSTRGAQF